MISLKNVTHSYSSGERPVRAVDDVSLEIRSGESVAITGPSGCGKSTLVHLIAGLDKPVSGEIFSDGLPLHTANDAQLTEFRRRRLGLVFQFFNLLPTMNALENVAFPLLLQGVSAQESEARAKELLREFGLGDRMSHFVHQLSGGEQQRTAIARALVHRPSILIADEPTGNLDTAATGTVTNLLRNVGKTGATTLLIVTHSEDVAQCASRRLQMRDGRIVADDATVASSPAFGA